MILVIFKTPEHSRYIGNLSLKDKLLHMDMVGAFLIIGAMVPFLLAMQWGGLSKAWSDSSVYGCLIACGLITILFIVVEFFQSDRALLVPHLLKQRLIWAGCLFAFFLSGAFFTILYYLPVYFQAVLGTSAEQSGVRNLALIIANMIASILAGGIITATGLFAPFMIAGSAITTISAGLFYTLAPQSSSGQWIGFQILAGFGIGLCNQVPVMAAQALANNEDIATVTAVLMFFQTLGGAIWVSAAQTGFANKLVQALNKKITGIDVAHVVAIGTTQYRHVFPMDAIPKILDSYMEGVTVVFIIVLAVAAASFPASLLTPWTDIRVATEEKKKAGVAVGAAG